MAANDGGDWKFITSGLPRNLENLEKGYFFDKVRENLW